MKVHYKKYASTLIVIPLLLFSTATLAEEVDCKTAVTTAEMRRCANDRYQAADAELNRVYRQLSAQLSDKRREQLKQAQRAWLAFRDKNAAFVASAFEGGTMYPILELSELTSMTTRRAEQLKAQLE